MDVELSIDDQEIWNQRRQRLEALTGANPSQQQHDPAQPDKGMDPLLFTVAKKGDVDMFIIALEDHCAKERVSLPVLLGQRSPSKNTLLHAAAESDDNVRAVIDFVPGHLISCKNSRGETPLHIAARAGKTEAVELLLPQGMPRYTDCCGNSALHEAVRNRRYEVIRRLVSEDPNPLYYQNNESKSPWCLAVETGDLKVLELLLEASNDGEDQRRSESQRVCGMSPAHVAILHKKLVPQAKSSLMRHVYIWYDSLLSYGAKLYADQDVGKKAVAISIKRCGTRHSTPSRSIQGLSRWSQFLIEKFPTSALEEDNTGYLPIHVACMMNHVGIVKKLLRQWPDPTEFPTKLGQNILHVSARYGSLATVEYIMKSPKFDHLINARDFDGNTPLHLAALHCQPTVVLLARDGRVDLKLVNNDHMTARDVVKQDMKLFFPPYRQLFTSRTLILAGTPSSPELATCKPTGRSLWNRLESQIDWEGHSEVTNSHAIVLALVASVTFTSGFSVPGGYNSSEKDAGIPVLLHKAMFIVFVISNSVAMYSTITALSILFWSYFRDPYVGPRALMLSRVPLLATLAAMPLAFMAGVYMTISKLPWLSFFTLVLGSIFLSVLLSVVMVHHTMFVWSTPLISRFTDKLLLWGLSKTGGDTAVTSVPGTRDDKPTAPPLE